MTSLLIIWVISVAKWIKYCVSSNTITDTYLVITFLLVMVFLALAIGLPLVPAGCQRF